MEGSSIPSGPEPVFTIAMRGLVITASGMTKQQKVNNHNLWLLPVVLPMLWLVLKIDNFMTMLWPNLRIELFMK